MKHSPDPTTFTVFWRNMIFSASILSLSSLLLLHLLSFPLLALCSSFSLFLCPVDAVVLLLLVCVVVSAVFVIVSRSVDRRLRPSRRVLATRVCLLRVFDSFFFSFCSNNDFFHSDHYWIVVRSTVRDACISDGNVCLCLACVFPSSLFLDLSLLPSLSLFFLFVLLPSLFSLNFSLSFLEQFFVITLFFLFVVSVSTSFLMILTLTRKWTRFVRFHTDLDLSGNVQWWFAGKRILSTLKTSFKWTVWRNLMRSAQTARLPTSLSPSVTWTWHILVTLFKILRCKIMNSWHVTQTSSESDTSGWVIWSHSARAIT